jgi:hypothetical protein
VFETGSVELVAIGEVFKKDERSVTEVRIEFILSVRMSRF